MSIIPKGIKPILKRLLLPVGFMPVSFYAFITWLITGKSASETIEQFINYCDGQ